jgi:hypothetical protein
MKAIDFQLPIKKPHVLGGALGLDAFGREALAYRCDALDGCDLTTSIQEDAIKYQSGTDSPSMYRPQGGLAVAVIRAHPGQNFPSLTSRGRQLTGGVEALFRDSHDEGRVGRRYGTRMKNMTTDPYSGLPSPEVPAKGGSREAACLMGQKI